MKFIDIEVKEKDIIDSLKSVGIDVKRTDNNTSSFFDENGNQVFFDKDYNIFDNNKYTFVESRANYTSESEDNVFMIHGGIYKNIMYRVRDLCLNNFNNITKSKLDCVA